MFKPTVTALRLNMRRALAEASFEEAENILARLKDEDPLSPETRGFELELCLNSGRLAEADTLARQLCHLFPQSGRVAFLAGKVAYKLKKYQEAAAHFRESHRIHPHWRSRYWLGKALTQSGQLGEAESLLLETREHTPNALLELAWLYERRNDLDAALRAYDDFLALNPDHAFAREQRLRVKARMMAPESLIEEVGALEDLGEEVSQLLFPDYIQRLFETGKTSEARERIAGRMTSLDPKTGARVAWVCYRAKAYDLACTLFLAHLGGNLSYFKYLNALEAAAAKCGRIPQVLETYRSLEAQSPNLYGRSKSLARHNANR